MVLIINIFFLIFLLGFCFWLISMVISSMTQAPYVVSAGNAIEKALELVRPKKDELIYDLGCGDARVLITAAKKYGTRGVGYDISPFCIMKSRFKIKLNKLQELIEIRRQSLFNADIEKADIIFLYLTNRILDKFEDQIFEKVKAGTRIVNLAFPFKKHQPIKTLDARQLGRNTKVYLYNV